MVQYLLKSAAFFKTYTMNFSLSKFPLIFQRRITVNILKFAGVGAACFVFEACYGTPQADFPSNPAKGTDIYGTVKTADGQAVQNAEVLFTHGNYSDTLKTYTDAQGNYSINDLSGDFKTCYVEANTRNGTKGSRVYTVKSDPKYTKNVQIDLVVKPE